MTFDESVSLEIPRNAGFAPGRERITAANIQQRPDHALCSRSAGLCSIAPEPSEPVVLIPQRRCSHSIDSRRNRISDSNSLVVSRVRNENRSADLLLLENIAECTSVDAIGLIRG